MNDFRIDGIRMDSVENVSNWDFIEEYKDLARAAWRERFAAQSSGGGVDERFLVVGEELHEPLELLRQRRLDGLWHESFKKYIRAALLGQNADDEPSFEWTVRKAINCRTFGYSDGAQAVIYLTSHDVEGYRNERVFRFLQINGVFDAEKRIKLAFACLLTAEGVPMILAGEEFADQHDLFDADGNVTQQGGKQVDPVNFSRLGDEWWRRIKEYVARLIKFRTTSDTLAVNDTEFIHVDFNDGKRCWPGAEGGPTRTKSPSFSRTSPASARTRAANTACPIGQRRRQASSGARSRRSATFHRSGWRASPYSPGKPRSMHWCNATRRG